MKDSEDVKVVPSPVASKLFLGGPLASQDMNVVPCAKRTVIEVRRFFVIGDLEPALKRENPHVESAFYTPEGRYIGRVCSCGQTHTDDWS